jgi:NTP pyrophosphatase (non-canonical NTP hydrolase)
MKLNEYQELASRTAHHHFNEKLNYALGLNGEAGEVADLIKKQVFHNHDINLADVAKELGDTLWYISNLARSYGFSLEGIAEMNIRKLQKRYPEGFSTEASVNRND